MKLMHVAALCAAGIALAGCATVVKGSSQSVAVATPPTTGATCTLKNPSSGETWTIVSPGEIKIEKSRHDLQVTCVKDGWQTATATLPSNFQGWTVGNLILGGFIGLGVDAASGAMNEYPNAFQVPMTPVGGSASSGGAAGTTASQRPTS